MLSLNRRTLLRSTGIAGIATATSSLFPELSPLAAFAGNNAAARSRPWYVEKGSAREATVDEFKNASDDYLPRLALVTSSSQIHPSLTNTKSDMPHSASMTVHTMQDGRLITAWAKPLNDTQVVAVYSETDARLRSGRSQAFIWEIDPSTKAARVAAQGAALERLSWSTHDAHAGGLPAAHAIDCGPGTYVCSYCVSFDGGFIDCCGPCGFAFIGGLVSGLACVLVWCNWCVWEHCTAFADSCCSA